MKLDEQPTQRTGALAVFDVRFALTPVTIAWVKYAHGCSYISWKSLYVFGVRLARWRVDT